MENITVHSNLEQERSRCSFLINELTFVLDGGERVTRARKRIENLLIGDNSIYGPDIRHMSRAEQFKELLKKSIEILKRHHIQTKQDISTFERSALNTHLTGLMMHATEFVPQLKLRSSKEQLNEWLPLASSYELIGCCSHMELGHGNNVEEFETYAIYDSGCSGFILNTPTLSSTKWWVGGLAKTANHILVDGHLYSRKKYYGLQMFLVQIRDHDHNLLPGVTIGEVGVKMGLEGVDDGYLRLNNVKIPKKNLLMRSVKDLEGGIFTNHDNEVLKTKIEEMMRVCRNAVYTLCLSITISIRYSSIRQQSILARGQNELQVIDYQTQQDKLFPIMCNAIALKLTLNKVHELLEGMNLDSHDPKCFELYILVSGLKVLITNDSSKCVELCRIACGGHGFSSASNFSTFYKNIVFNVTEEEEVVVHPETSRFFLRKLESVNRGKKMKGFFKYMQGHKDKFSGSFTLDSLLEASEEKSLRALEQSKEDLIKCSDRESELNRSDRSEGLKQAILAHAKNAVAIAMTDKVRNFEGSVGVGDALDKICRLYLVKDLLQASGDLIKNGYFTKNDINGLREELCSLYDIIRPCAVSIVDAFDFHDKQLNSVLGSYGGDVYKELFDWARTSQLNEVEVHSSFHEYLKPIRTMDKTEI